MRGEHAHEYDGDDGNVIEASKNTNDLPETLGCKLEQGAMPSETTAMPTLATFAMRTNVVSASGFFARG